MSTTDTKPQQPTHEGERSHAEIMVIITALMLAMLLAALDQTIVSTALPRIATDLKSLNRISWVATAYLLTSAVSTPLYGKIGDLFGRKKIFQFAIIVFLIGSALSGLSQNMDQLIAFRAVQGLGAGGLMSQVLAIIGDIIPPRQRGRYQGYFVGTWALASIIGPLLGGFLTDSLSWRWIFYVNIPIGLIALTAIAARLHLPVRKTEHRLDLLGALTLGVGVTCLLLVTVLGGITYGWLSAPIIGLSVAALVLIAWFIVQEHRAAEPLLPLRLFRNNIFSISVVMSFLTGAVMFGSLLYLPYYQQIVRGYSATKSGLYLLPLVVGLMIASIISGRIISKVGKYRAFPIIGSAVTIFALWLFTHISLSTSQLTLSVWMVILGFGVGSFMQVMTLAVQNSVDRSELGTATSATVFFRSVGSSFGAAIFGAILVDRLSANLHHLLPARIADHINTNSIAAGTGGIAHFPAAVTHDILQAFVVAFRDVFIWAIPLAVLCFILALFLRESPLRESTREMAEGESLKTD
jgi:EmrB/QacA subfamily drug resistance transporter